jgi:DNA-binding transcriptional MerR regulator
MTTQAETLWTIHELGAQAALALSVDYPGPANGRVREIPDQRTIRYYTTLGLLDRPAEMRGRTALYGRRHLLQLVAIKRLQARGLSLSAIQQQLLGLGDAALRRLANLPEQAETAEGSKPAFPSPPSTAREPFWSAAPAAPSLADGEREEGEQEQPAAQPAGPAARAILQGIPLDDEVMVLLASVRPLDDDDLQAIRAAAAPMLKLLETRRLLGPSTHKENS